MSRAHTHAAWRHDHCKHWLMRCGLGAAFSQSLEMFGYTGIVYAQLLPWWWLQRNVRRLKGHGGPWKPVKAGTPIGQKSDERQRPALPVFSAPSVIFKDLLMAVLFNGQPRVVRQKKVQKRIEKKGLNLPGVSLPIGRYVKYENSFSVAWIAS